MSKLTDFCDNFIEQTLPMAASTGWDSGASCLSEQVQSGWSPVDVGFQRSMLHGRQLYVFSTWGTLLGNAAYLDLADHVYENLTLHFQGIQPGAWIDKISATPDFVPVDTRMSLYSHAFVIFGMATYAMLRERKDAYAKVQASLMFLDQYFARQDASGLFYTQLNQACEPENSVFLQNPHMHLFETLLQLYALTRENDVLARIKPFYEKFSLQFLRSHVIVEKTPSTPSACAGLGSGGDVTVEPGHLAEWAWLLRWTDELMGKTSYALQTGQQLLHASICHGWDQVYGGLYDVLAYPDFQVVKKSKRLWPQLELLKALLVYNQGPHLQMDYGCSVEQIAQLLIQNYMHMDGSWNEHLQANLHPIVGTMPLSSLYHMSMAVLQARAYKGLPTLKSV